MLSSPDIAPINHTHHRLSETVLRYSGNIVVTADGSNTARCSIVALRYYGGFNATWKGGFVISLCGRVDASRSYLPLIVYFANWISADIINFDSKDRIFHYPKYYPRCQEGQKLERGCGTNGFKGTTGHKESIPPGPGVSARKEGGACSEGHDAQKCSAQIICPFLALVVLCKHVQWSNYIWWYFSRPYRSR